MEVLKHFILDFCLLKVIHETGVINSGIEGEKDAWEQ